MADRRADLRARLVACARTAIEGDGLVALRARSVALCAGCSVGAIYNVVQDLDELILLVAQGTLADLDARLSAADAPNGRPDVSCSARLVAWALAYCSFAVENRNLWRALFEFRLSPGRDLPSWFQRDQTRLFDRLEAALAEVLPHHAPETRRLRARTLFSAVHGIVALGIEEKIAAMPIASVEHEVTTFVRTYLSGEMKADRSDKGSAPS